MDVDLIVIGLCYVVWYVGGYVVDVVGDVKIDFLLEG